MTIRIGANPIAKREKSDHASRPRNPDHCVARALKRTEFVGCGGEIDAFFLQEARAANDHVLTIQSRPNSATGHRLEPGQLRRRYAPFQGGRHDGLAQGMFRGRFRGGCHSQQRFRRLAEWLDRVQEYAGNV